MKGGAGMFQSQIIVKGYRIDMNLDTKKIECVGFLIADP
jgi:hypothetical protein